MLRNTLNYMCDFDLFLKIQSHSCVVTIATTLPLVYIAVYIAVLCTHVL